MTIETNSNASGGAGQRIPPYISFKTLTTFAEDQKQHGMPARIDRSVLTHFSGGVGTQLIVALKFLGLIDSDGNSTEALRQLVDAYGTDGWPRELATVISRAYGPVVALDLASLTPKQFHEVFTNNYSAANDVMRKCETFFIHACNAAQIPINSRIIKHRVSRGNGRRRKTGGKGRTNGGKPKPDQKGGASKDRRQQETLSEHTTYDMLIDILDPANMDDDERNAVWTLIRYLKKQETAD